VPDPATPDPGSGARWSELDPVRLEIELAKLGIMVGDLVKDAEDVPELHEMMELLSPEAKARLALEWFGDQGHPQPEERTPPVIGAFLDHGSFIYGDLTPNWGWLPPLAPEEDSGPREGELSQTKRLAGSYVATETFWPVWEMACDGASANGIDNATNKGAIPGLEYVNRDKAGAIVKEVRADVTAAREALRLRKLPQPFVQTAAGVKLPQLRSK
jgi:hypothetical protein